MIEDVQGAQLGQLVQRLLEELQVLSHVAQVFRLIFLQGIREELIGLGSPILDFLLLRNNDVFGVLGVLYLLLLHCCGGIVLLFG